jgi:CysZ protein
MFGDLWAGFAAPWRGLVFLGARPRTWALALVPALIASVLFVFFGWLLVRGSTGWIAALIPKGDAAQTTGRDWGSFVVRWLLDGVVIILSLAVALYTSLTLASPLSAKPLEALVRVRDEERGAATYPTTAWTTSSARALGAGLVGLAVSIVVTIIVTVLNLVVPAFAVATAPIGALLSGYVVAWNLLDYPLGLRAMTLRDRARWMGAHMTLMTGFAVSSFLFLFVPGLGLLLLPAGVVGAAIVVERVSNHNLG